MRAEANPFTDPRDANLAEAWDYGRKIGKRRERIIIAFMIVVGLLALSTCAMAPALSKESDAGVYNLSLRFTGQPGHMTYKRDFKSYKDCYDFATGPIIEADIAMLIAANPRATIERACGVEVD